MKVRVSHFFPGDMIVGYLAPTGRCAWVYAVPFPSMQLKRMFFTVVKVDNHNIITTTSGRQLFCYDFMYDCVNR